MAEWWLNAFIVIASEAKQSRTAQVWIAALRSQ